MTNEEQLYSLRKNYTQVEENLTDNRQQYQQMNRRVEEFAQLAQDSEQFYQELFHYYRGTDFQRELSRDWEGVQYENKQHQQSLEQRLEELTEEYGSLKYQKEQLQACLQEQERSSETNG